MKEDFTQIFPKKPCPKSFKRTAEKLFREGGAKNFPASVGTSEETSELVEAVAESTKFEQGVQVDLVDYRENSELESSILSQTQDKFLKQSQENSSSQGSETTIQGYLWTPVTNT